MSSLAPRDSGFAHLLFPLLIAAFGVAASATVAGAPRPGGPAPAVDVTPLSVEVASAPDKGVPARDRLVAVQVADVLLPEGDGASVALLMDNGARYVLPVVVGTGDGRALRNAIKREEKRDETLVVASSGARDRLRALGGEIEHVEVQESGDDFSAAIVVKVGHESVRVEATPGEALSVALGAGSPVYVLGGVLVSRGISREAVSKRPGGIPSNLRDPERL